MSVLFVDCSCLNLECLVFQMIPNTLISDVQSPLLCSASFEKKIDGEAEDELTNQH